MRSFDEILAKIAHDNGTTPEDVLHEMQVAIDDAYDHHDQEAQQLWDRMTFKGDTLCLWPILASTPLLYLKWNQHISFPNLFWGSPSCGTMLTVTNSFGFDTV